MLGGSGKVTLRNVMGLVGAAKTTDETMMGREYTSMTGFWSHLPRKKPGKKNSIFKILWGVTWVAQSVKSHPTLDLSSDLYLRV